MEITAECRESLRKKEEKGNEVNNKRKLSILLCVFSKKISIFVTK